MTSPDDDLQKWFSSLASKAERRMGEKLRQQANRVCDAIKSAAAIGDTGSLAESVRVIEGRQDRVELVVVAGGELTTRSSAGGSYDYALAVEFGTSKMEPNPFFYSTWSVMADDVNAELQRAAQEVLS